MRWLILGLVWAGSLAAVFVLGRESAPEPPPVAETPRGESGDDAALREEIRGLRERLAARMERVPPEETDEPTRRTGASRRTPRGPGGLADVEVPMDGPLPSFEGLDSAEDVSARLMAFVEQQLARGEAGTIPLLKAMAAIEDSEVLRRLFAEEDAAVRHFYPWIRFLVEREDRVVNLTENVFRTMAESPQSLSWMEKDDALEIFTQGAAMLLPGIVSEERMATFRALAKKVLETPTECSAGGHPEEPEARSSGYSSATGPSRSRRSRPSGSSRPARSTRPRRSSCSGW
jgi:hypothetical protein